MARAMPRLLLVMVLTLLVAAPAAMAGTRADIVADCFDDGKLDGNYSASQIRDARNNLPADVDQYSDCRDVLARALGGSGSRDIGGSGGGALGGGGGGRRRRAGGVAHAERPGGAARARGGGRPPAATSPCRSATAPSCRARRASAPAPPATRSPTSLLVALILLGIAALAAARALRPQGRRPVRRLACPRSPARLRRRRRARSAPTRARAAARGGRPPAARHRRARRGDRPRAGGDARSSPTAA